MTPEQIIALFIFAGVVLWMVGRMLIRYFFAEKKEFQEELLDKLREETKEKGQNQGG